MSRATQHQLGRSRRAWTALLPLSPGLTGFHLPIRAWGSLLFQTCLGSTRSLRGSLCSHLKLLQSNGRTLKLCSLPLPTLLSC